ncbi:Tuberous sclerosis 2-like protein [Savitreella phatthalungensis]
MSNIRSLFRGIQALDVRAKDNDPKAKYERYIARLRNPLNLSESVATCRKLVNWIEHYQLGNPAEPWIACRRLADAKMPNEARVAAAALLRACLEAQTNLSVVSRLGFFHDIQHLFLEPDDLDIKVDSLRALTKQGRDVTGFEGQICSVCAGWLNSYLDQLNVRKHVLRRSKVLEPSQRHRELQDLLYFITDLAKIHFIVLNEQDVRTLVEQVVSVCKRTSDLADIQAAMNFFDATIRYGYIPLEILPEVVSVLCSVYKSLTELETPAFSIFQKLLQSHMSQSGLRCLQAIISGKRNVHEDVVAGALSMTLALKSESTSDSSFDMSTYTLLTSLQAGVDARESREGRNLAVLDVTYAKATVKVVQLQQNQSPLTYEDWDPPLNIFSTVCRSLAITEVVPRLVETLSEFLRWADDEVVQKRFHGSLAGLAELRSYLAPYLDQTASLGYLDYCAGELMCFPSDSGWLNTIKRIGGLYLVPRTSPEAVRVKTLQHFREVLALAPSVSDNIDELHNILLEQLEDVAQEPDNELTAMAVAVVTDVALDSSGETFARAVAALQSFCALPRELRPSSASSPPPSATMLGSRRASVESVTSFSSVFTRQSARAKQVPPQVTTNSMTRPNSPKVVSVAPSRHVSLSATHGSSPAGEPLDRELARSSGKSLVRVFLDRFRKAPDGDMHALFSCLINVASSDDHFVSARLEILSLLGRLRADSSYMLYCDMPPGEASAGAAYDAPLSSYTCLPNDVSIGEDNFTSLPVDRWLACLTELLHTERLWSALSAVHDILLEQLTNRHLFEKFDDNLQDLRLVLCDQLNNQRLPVAQLPPDFKREDVVARLVPIMTSLVGYHTLFTKAQEDEIVGALQNTLMRYQKASPACIHALFVCFHEIPLSTSKVLSTVLLRLSQLITSTNASVHILELLSALARSPDQYVNFREEDYRRVFGVALQHIQYANATSRDALASGTVDPLTQPMPAYVLGLAFDVVYAWFLAVKLPQRSRYLRWIVDGLLASVPGEKTLDHRGQVCYDFLVRFCYSNAEIRNTSTVFTDFEASASSSKTWLYGNAVMTLRTMHLSGLSEIIIRRPSGTNTFLCKPSSDFESLSLLTSADAQTMVSEQELVGPYEMHLRNVVSGAEDDVTFTPSHLLLQLSVVPELTENVKPLLLNEDDAVRRSLATFDRIPVVDFHKIGVIFVGRGQTSQRDILSNTFGSTGFVEFLSGMGDLIRLKNNSSIYTGGLDTSNDEDGEFAYALKEKISQIILHTTTLMPNHQSDPDCNRKLAHIGNDYVNIVWNASNRPFDPETIRTDFNFCSVVVAPDAYQARGGSESGVCDFYKVKVLYRRGLVPLGPACDWRLISRAKLPQYVRTLAMACNIWAQTFTTRSTVSNWTQRLIQIKRIEERARAALTQQPQQQSQQQQHHQSPHDKQPHLQGQHERQQNQHLSQTQHQHQHQQQTNDNDANTAYDFVSYN